MFLVIRLMSGDEIRPQGRGLAQLATLNTAEETRRGQLHGSRGTVDRTPMGQLATRCYLTAAYFSVFSDQNCRTEQTDPCSSCNPRFTVKHPRVIFDTELTLMLAHYTVRLTTQH